MENQIQKHTGAQLQKTLLPDMEKISEFVDSVANSNLFNAPFKSKNPDTGEMEIDKSSIIACVILGMEMGLAPAASLMMGKKLNQGAYFSVMRGNALGLDPITSISKIYNITTSAGSILSLAVDIIVKVMIDSGCILDYIRDYEYTPIYKDLVSGIYVGHQHQLTDKDGNLKSNFFIYKDGISGDEIKEAKSKGSTIIVQSGQTYVTTLRIIRKLKGEVIFDNTFHYSIQDAIEAGLHRGYSVNLVDKAGKPLLIEGRDNWNKHPSTMLRNRVSSIGGRIAVADKLQGTYSHEEAMEIVKVKNEEELAYTNAEVVDADD